MTTLTHAEKVHLFHRGPWLKYDPAVDEAMVTKQVKDYLARTHPAMWKHWQGGYRSKDGVSDFIGCLRDGRFCAIEVKRPGKKPTPEQIAFLENKAQSNGLAFWTDSLEGLIEGLKEGT